MEKPEREIILLVGLPGVGKTSYLRNNSKDFKGYTIISLDNLIEKRAKEISFQTGRPTSADDIWAAPDEVAKLRKQWEFELQQAIDRDENIVIDGLNATPEIRKQRVQCAKSSEQYDYSSTAIVIHPPEESEHIDRLMKRGLLDRQLSVINYMHRNVIPVTEDEFDKIIYFGKPPEKPIYHEYNSAADFRLVDLFAPEQNSQNVRILLAGPINTDDSIFREINGYNFADHEVTVNTHYLGEGDKESLKQHYSHNPHINFCDFNPESPDELRRVIIAKNKGFDVVIYPPGIEGFTPDVLNAAVDKGLQHNLQVIGCPNDAISHLAAIADLVKDHNVTIVNTPNVHADAVAEYTLSQIGFHARRLNHFYHETGRDRVMAAP